MKGGGPRTGKARDDYTLVDGKVIFPELGILVKDGRERVVERGTCRKIFLHLDENASVKFDVESGKLLLRHDCDYIRTVERFVQDHVARNAIDGRYGKYFRSNLRETGELLVKIGEEMTAVYPRYDMRMFEDYADCVSVTVQPNIIWCQPDFSYGVSWNAVAVKGKTSREGESAGKEERADGEEENK